MIIMRRIRGDEGGEKERSGREAGRPGDGEILVEVWPVDPEPAADQLPAISRLVTLPSEVVPCPLRPMRRSGCRLVTCPSNRVLS